MATTIPDSSYGGKSSGQAGGKTYNPPSLNQAIQSITTPGNPSYSPQIGGAFNSLYGQIAPFLPGAQAGLLNAQQGVNSAINQFGTIQAGNDYQSQLLQQQNQIAQQQLGLQQQQTGIGQGALNRQQQMLPQQNALQQQLFGIANQGLGLSGQQLGLQGQQLALQGQGIDQAQQTAYRQYGLNKNSQIGGAAAAGANNSQGNRTNLGELAAQLQDQLSSFAQSRQGLDISKQGLDISKQQLGLQQQQQGIGEQQYGLSYQEQQAQLADQQKNFDILSKQYGLNSEDLTNRLNQGLAQIGLSTALSAGDVANSIVNAQKGISDSITPILGYLYQAIGLGPIGAPNG